MKLTKTELRKEERRLNQLKKYLPVLQLKKMLLQAEVSSAQKKIDALSKEFQHQITVVSSYALLFSSPEAFDLFPLLHLIEVQQEVQNIAGVDLPVFKQVVFQAATYPLFGSPIWLDSAMLGARLLIELREKVKIAKERKELLEKELREVSIRANLFEKVLIPKGEKRIRAIKIFLGDLLLSAVCQARVAKAKILSRGVAA